MAQNLGASQGMEQTLNPKMIAFYELLQQPNVELEQAIESELQDNPALDVSAERICPACGSKMLSAVCRECGYKLTREDEEAFETPDPDTTRDKILDLAIEASPMEKPSYTGDDDGFDVMARLTATETLCEHLRWLWRMSCSEAHRDIGEQLIGCINDDGYLDTDLETFAEALDVPLETIEAVLKEIQNLEPAGVGARTLRECLRLQLVHRDKGAKAEVAQLALKLLDDHWQALARHSYEDIARKLKTTVEHVQAGADFVRGELSPYPGRQFRPSWEGGGAQPAGRVRPDVEIKKAEDREGYVVEVVESRALGLRVNAVYRQLWDAMRKDPAGYSSKDREHVQTYLTRAREFIDNLNQRRKTLKLIIEAVADEQGAFLEAGLHSLKPLTRLSVAHKLGLHESTVGRAVAGKYALLPSGEVVGCELFFDASLSVKEVIKDLLAAENPRKPFSDEQISAELSKKGIEIARRTVTKYREALKIPPAAQRRRYD